jgi:hypothetical protein
MATRATIRFQDGEDREHAVAIQKWRNGDATTVRSEIFAAIGGLRAAGEPISADVLASTMLGINAIVRGAYGVLYHVMHVDAEPDNDHSFRVICFGSEKPPTVLRYDREEGCEVECSDPHAPQAQGVAG